MDAENLAALAAQAGDFDDVNGFNGFAGTVEIATVATFIKECNYLVVTQDQQVDIVRTLAHAFWVINGKPNEELQLTPDHFSAAKEAMVYHYSQYALMATFSHIGGFALTYRSSDIITAAAFDNLPLGCVDLLQPMMNLLAAVRLDPVLEAQFVAFTPLQLMAVVANAIHRVTTNGHNFITKDIGDPNTAANSAVGVAGPNRSEFENYMKKFGHDGWHHFSDSLLYKLAGIITGNELDDNGEAVEDGDLKVFGPGTTVGGIAVEGQKVHMVLKLGEAAKDRWPVGTLGVSAAILGCNYVISMLNTICLKVQVDEATIVVSGISKIQNMLEEGVERSVLLDLKSKFSGLFAIAFGYAQRSSSGAAMVAKHPSITAFCKSQVQYVTTGIDLGKVIDDLEVDVVGVKAAISAVLAAAARGMLAVAATAGFNSDEVAEIEGMQYTTKLQIPLSTQKARAKAIEAAKELAASGLTEDQIVTHI